MRPETNGSRREARPNSNADRRERIASAASGWKATPGPANRRLAVVKHLRVERESRQRLAEQIEALLAEVNAQQGGSIVRRQFAFRQRARDIALDTLGDGLLNVARRHLQAGRIVVWDGLPESSPAPPDADRLTFGQGLVSAIAQGTTQSFGYQQEEGGQHYQRLTPVAGVTHGGKTPDQLLKHLDNPFLKVWAQPEVIHLVCVNNDAQAATEFLTMEAVLRGLLEGYGQQVIDLLRRPAYLTAVSNSFVRDSDQKQVQTRPRPILYGDDRAGNPTHFLGKAYDASVPPGLEDSDLCQQALDAYQTVLKERADLAISLTAQPGQAVSFHQQRLLHGRGAIGSARYREMVRSYGRFDLSELLKHTGRAPANLVFDAMELVDR